MTEMKQSKFLKLDAVAELLGLDRQAVMYLVAEGKLRCGVFAKAWLALPIPFMDGTLKLPRVGGTAQPGTHAREYQFIIQSTAEPVRIYAESVTDFCFLGFGCAHKLAVISPGGIDLEFLEPEDGRALHAADPSQFPWPAFTYHLLTDDTQKTSRHITWDDLLFRRSDANGIEGASPGRTAAAVPVTNHDYKTHDLALMELAARTFWGNADRDDKTTHRSNPVVAKWLEDHGFSSATLALKAASIIRPKWAGPGRTPKS